MNVMKTMIAGAALAAVFGSPAFAQRQGIGESAPSLNTPAGATNPRTSGRHATVRGQHSRAGYRARAQVPATQVPASGRQLGDPRENALRECSEMSRRYTQTTWGHMDIHQHRTCMMQHGQPE
jgi:hypothetical protein